VGISLPPYQDFINLIGHRLVFDDEVLTKWFLFHGANPNAQCGSGLDLTPLSIAVSEAPYSIIEMLFNHGGSIKHGQLVHYAVRRNMPDCLKVLKFLISRGASINHVMYYDCPHCYHRQSAFGLGTPLHEAADEGKLDVVKFLLERGADPLVKDSRGRLAIERAEHKAHTVVVEHLRSLSSPSELRRNLADGYGVGENQS